LTPSYQLRVKSMLFKRRTVWAPMALLLFTAACSSGREQFSSVPLPAAALSASSGTTSIDGIPNVFASAKGKPLTDADIDGYIDASVVGADRVLARHLMSLMPANHRGDFVYLSRAGHLVSNNPIWAARAKITRGTLERATPGSASRRHKADYSDTCSPPNPPTRAGGPYVRLVSTCGFSAGWGFVSVPHGTSRFGAGEAGHLYFEIQAPNQGTTTEGGFEYYNDASIAPYGRSTAAEYASTNNGYLQLTNGGARFSPTVSWRSFMD
jgi:hypothetical protein